MSIKFGLEQDAASKLNALSFTDDGPALHLEETSVGTFASAASDMRSSSAVAGSIPQNKPSGP